MLLAAGVFVARGRRRALIGVGLGVAASMVVLAIGLLIARSIYLNSVPASVLPTDAAAAAFDALVHFLRQGLRVVLAVGLVIAIGAFITGPSRAAVRTRASAGSGITSAAEPRRAPRGVRLARSASGPTGTAQCCGSGR